MLCQTHENCRCIYSAKINLSKIILKRENNYKKFIVEQIERKFKQANNVDKSRY